MTLNLKDLSPAALEPRAAAVNHNDHFVELYEDDASLAASIRTSWRSASTTARAPS